MPRGRRLPAVDAVTIPLMVTKVMSLSLDEFTATVARLDPSPSELDTGRFVVPIGGGHVAISYAALDPVALGGLLKLPRGEVVLTFSEVGDDDRIRFMTLFDRTFQRGGG